MSVMDFLVGLGGISISVMGYFLKSSLNELKEVQRDMNEVIKKVAVIESDYINKFNNLTEKFDELHDVIKDLTREIKDLTRELHDKKKV